MGIKTSRKMCIISNSGLLIWFFLDMIGISISEQILVSRSFTEDGIFFIIFAVLLIWFMIKDKLAKYLLCGWLFLWFVTQFFSHWYFTILGTGEEKIEVFADTIKLISSSDIYIADLYHIVLHLLILIAFFFTITYCIKSRKQY